MVLCMGNFSCALSKLQVISRNSDWFIAQFVPVVIGRSNNYIGFGFFDSHLKTMLSSYIYLGLHHSCRKDQMKKNVQAIISMT